jgi:hypothetical protein
MADAGRALRECANFTRGGGPPAPDHDADYATREKRVKAEEKRLIEWAKNNGKLGTRLPPEYTRGGEHYVFYQRRRRRYLKATLPHRHKGFGIALGSFVHGATPAEYLQTGPSELNLPRRSLVGVDHRQRGEADYCDVAAGNQGIATNSKSIGRLDAR